MHELQLNEIQKRYKDKIAVQKINYTFSKGVYGLLGENGAGKTTLLRLLCGILQPTTGNICCDGMDIWQMGAEYRRLLGYLPQELGYYENFTAEKFLHYIAALKNLPIEYAEQRIQKLLDMVELQDTKKKKLKTFSGGMLRRVGIAQALLNDPEILILDEPTAGLDPKERVRFRNIISSLGKEKTVLLSTHIVSDIEYIADQILIMKNGELIRSGTEQEITAGVNGYVWICKAPAEIAQKLCTHYLVSNLRNCDSNKNVELRIISEKKPTENARIAEEILEDAYLYYTQNAGGMKNAVI